MLHHPNNVRATDLMQPSLSPLQIITATCCLYQLTAPLREGWRCCAGEVTFLCCFAQHQQDELDQNLFGMEESSR